MPFLSVFDGHVHGFDCTTCHIHECQECRNWHWCASTECGNFREEEGDDGDVGQISHGLNEMCPSCLAPRTQRLSQVTGQLQEMTSHPCGAGHFCGHCDGAWWCAGPCTRGRATRCNYCAWQARLVTTENPRSNCNCNGCRGRD